MVQYRAPLKVILVCIKKLARLRDVPDLQRSIIRTMSSGQW
jgi:hypothetical protein